MVFHEGGDEIVAVVITLYKNVLISMKLKSLLFVKDIYLEN